MRRGRRLLGVAVVVVSAAAVPAVSALAPPVPVLHEETVRGSGSTERVKHAASGGATPPGTCCVVDGATGDWVGEPTGWGGTAVYSRGEYVYQDHLFDAYGADNGGDAERLGHLDPLAAAEPRTYRLEPLIRQDPAGEFGVPAPAQLRGEHHYGDLSHVDEADLLEVRVASAPGAEGVHVLARTTTMRTAAGTAVLVLADTSHKDAGARPVGFGSGLTTERAELAFLLAGDRGWRADLLTGSVSELPPGSVATNPSGWVNAVEASLPGVRPGPGHKLRLAVMTGRSDGAGGMAAVANVAFRAGEAAEPVRTWFDKRQALSLWAGSVDSLFATVDTHKLAKGWTERYRPGPGYHDRIFRSAEAVSSESGQQGVHQHYGVYLPRAWGSDDAPERFALQWWLHWRGGSAHVAGDVIPRLFRDLGDDHDTIVVSPSGRGGSTWYVGRGHVDVLEVWEDVMGLLPVDRERVYVTGHSMGGWGSYLLPVLYPDRFAATLPVAGPVTQGAWTGLDFPGCDNFAWQGNTPCYVAANGSNPRAQHTRKLLENLRHVPVAIFQGAADELVPVSGVTRQAERLAQLGYRHRYYLFPTHEHYTHPVMDEWAEGGRYLHSFRRPQAPARVTYVRDMPFERATETVQSGGLTLDFSFDSAYWMSGLAPVNATSGVARFDGRSLALTDEAVVTVPEAGGPASLGQAGPYAMTGLRWLADPLTPAPALRNGFSVTLDGASAVTLDLPAMGVDTGRALEGTVDTEHPLTLELSGPWVTAPSAVSCGGTPVPASIDGGVLVVSVPAGVCSLAVVP